MAMMLDHRSQIFDGTTALDIAGFHAQIATLQAAILQGE
jgi:hypothetical protein